MSDWQPIETAPKDGTAILAWEKDWECPAVVSLEEYDGTEYWEYRESLINDAMGEAFPTHWIPLPDAPK